MDSSKLSLPLQRCSIIEATVDVASPREDSCPMSNRCQAYTKRLQALTGKRGKSSVLALHQTTLAGAGCEAGDASTILDCVQFVLYKGPVAEPDLRSKPYSEFSEFSIQRRNHSTRAFGMSAATSVRLRIGEVSRARTLVR